MQTDLTITHWVGDYLVTISFHANRIDYFDNKSML